MTNLVWLQGSHPDIYHLWQAGFGDEASCIDRFFRHLPQVHTLAALQDGAHVSMAIAMDGLTLHRPGLPALPLVYAYCVTTLPEHRGCGHSRAIMRALAEQTQQAGALLCWRPATPSLADWYARILPVQAGFPAVTRTVQAAAASDSLQALPAAPADYAEARHTLLCNRAHVSFSPALLALQEEAGRESGGGLFLLQDGQTAGCAVTECGSDGTLFIKELLCPGIPTGAAVQSLLQTHNMPRAVLRMPPDGCPAAENMVQTASVQPVDGIEQAWFGLFFD